MAGDCKQDEKNGVSFFTSLRRLGRDVDLGVKDIHSKLDASRLQPCDDRRRALKGLRDRKKDIESMKENASSLLKEVRHKSKGFDETLRACSDVIDIQLQQLSNIQAFLTQYGFVQQQDTVTDDSPDESASDTAEASEDLPSTPPEQSAPKAEVEKKCKLTPCLEDFGLSSYTLNMLSRPAQQAAFKVPSVAPQQSELHVRSVAGRNDSVPTPFQTRGLTVTPSLFSQTKCFGTGNRSIQEPFSLPCTPDMTSCRPEPPTAEQEDQLQSSQKGLRKTLDFSDSPVPPVLHTPGVKQISPLSQPPPAPPQGGRGPVARQLKLGEDGGQHCDSPVPPILRTPGIQQISDTHFHGKDQMGGPNHDQLELPQTPELTFSLKDLADMSLSFKHADLTATSTESSTSIPSDTTSSELPCAGTFPQPTHRRENPPPPPPHFQQGYSTHPAVPEPQLSHWSMNRVRAECLELPESPELTMSYTNVSRSYTLSQAAASTTSAGQGYRTKQGMKGQDTFPRTELSSVSMDRHDSYRLGSRLTTSQGEVQHPGLSSVTKDMHDSYRPGTRPATNQGEIQQPGLSRNMHDSYRPAPGHSREMHQVDVSSVTKDRNDPYRTETRHTRHREIHQSEPFSGNKDRLYASHPLGMVEGSRGASTHANLASVTKGQFSSHRSAAGVTHQGELPTQELSNMTTARFGSYRTGLSGEDNVPEPQLSGWTTNRYNTMAVDLPATPELTMSYTSLARSYTTAAHSTSAVSTHELDASAGLTAKGHAPRKDNTTVLPASAALPRGSILAKDACSDFPLPRGGIPAKEAGSDMPRSKENRVHPSLQRPAIKGRLDPGLTVPSLPERPRLQEPLKDSNADLPPTPKFMGSYHFMG